MKHSMLRVRLFALALLVTSLGFGTPVLTQFAYDGGAFIKLPMDKSHWLQVDDKAQLCHLMHNEFIIDEPQGVRLYDPRREMHFFLAIGGSYYSSSDLNQAWKLEASGTPLKDVAWSHDPQYLAWQSFRYWFINDPRQEDYAKTWYQVGPGKSCHVFTEASRSYGAANVQSVVLSSGVEGVPAWTLSNGSASLLKLKETGNWIYR